MGGEIWNSSQQTLKTRVHFQRKACSEFVEGIDSREASEHCAFTQSNSDRDILILSRKDYNGATHGKQSVLPGQSNRLN